MAVRQSQSGSPVRLFFGLLIVVLTAMACSSNSPAVDVEQPENPSADESKPTIDPAAGMVLHDADNNYWFASEAGGIFRYDGTSVQHFGLDDGLCSTRVLSVEQHQNGTICFDTPDCIYAFDGTGFTQLQVADTTTKWSIAESDLLFRMGWNHRGVFRFDGEQLHFLRFPTTSREKDFYALYPNISYDPYGTYSLFRDSQGMVWCGTSSLGIYLFDGTKGRWHYESQWTDTPAGGAFGIRSVIEDHQGNFWICNVNKRYTPIYTESAGGPIHILELAESPGIPGHEDQYFMEMVTDQHGTMWLLTYQEGPWRQVDEQLERMDIVHNGQQLEAKSVCKDKNGVLWFGTKEHGVFSFDGKTFQQFPGLYN